MASFHNWTGDEEIDTQVPQFLNEDNAATQEKLDTKLGKNDTAAAAIKDGAGNTISTTYASKADVSALLSTKLGVNSTAYAATRDGDGNIINTTYAKKTDISGMVKSVNGKEPDAGGNVDLDIIPIANGGTGATTAKQARANLEVEPIGTIYAFAGNNIPAGYLPCNGSAISRTTYADLFAVIGTAYGSGDGSTTFNLPNFENNSFMEFSGTVGKAKRAGLPNIKGSMRGLFGTGDISETFYTGAFESGTAGTQRMGTAGAVIDCQVYFNAAKISNVYSNDINTVQPKSVTVRAIIKY